MWQLLNPENDSQPLAPMPHQWDFATSPANSTLLAGGFGSGKSYGGLMFCGVSAWMSPPGSVGIAAQPNFTMMEEWLEEQLLPAFQPVIKKHSVKKRCLYLPGNRKLYYRSAHIPQDLQMSNAAWLYLDEPHRMKAQIYFHAIARARKKGARIRVGMTSIPKIGWLSEEFEGQDNRMRRLMRADTRWNAKNLHPDYIPNLINAIPKRMLACYIEGQFVPAGGSVWPEFDTGVHVIPWKYSPTVLLVNGQRVRSVVNLAVDWSPRKPHVLWIQRVPQNTKMPGGWVTTRDTSIVIDEIYPDRELHAITTVGLCNLIKKRNREMDYFPSEAIVDPAGKTIQSTSGESDIIQMRRNLELPVFGLPGQLIKTGVQHVQLALEPAAGMPFLFVSDSLVDQAKGLDGKRARRPLIRAMQGYSYPESKDGRLEAEPYDDDIVTHACDCIRYHVRYYHAVDSAMIKRWDSM